MLNSSSNDWEGDNAVDVEELGISCKYQWYYLMKIRTGLVGYQ